MRIKIPALYPCLLLALPAVVLAQQPAGDQAPDDDENGQPSQQSGAVTKAPKKYFRFEFRAHPSIRAGGWFRADLRVKFKHDFRTFDPEISTEEGELSSVREFRVGVEGYITKHLEYAIDRELRNEFSDFFKLRTRETSALWRDIYGNFRYFRRFQLRFGQFKIPFGMDQLKYSTEGEFVNRSLIGNFLAPGRDVGLMLHGRWSDGRIAYQAGWFRNDGWRAHDKQGERTGERTFAGRIVLPPVGLLPGSFLKPLRNLNLGGAFTDSPVTEGLRSLRGRTWVATYNWFDRINVRGHRLRLGAELNWEPGPFVLKGEVIRVRDQRLGQGIRNEDLPDLISRGWYFTAGWVVTGEHTEGGVKPRKDLITGKGWGAVQIAARYEQLRFGSSEHPGAPSRSSRAANIYSESERIATFGVNWYWNRFIRIQFNAAREVIEDIQHVPVRNFDTYWSRYLRIQFVL